MPQKNGIECLDDIKKLRRQLGSAKIVMLTTAKEPRLIDKAFHLGADLYAVKPVSFNALQKLIRSVIEFDWSTPASRDRFLLAS